MLRKQRRAFHRIISGLKFHFWRGDPLRWMHLTSSPTSDFSKIRYHFQMLRKSIRRHLGLVFEYIAISTTEGNGVLHVPIAGGGYIPQEYLSSEWNRIHGAPVVWISAIWIPGFRPGPPGWQERIASYLVTQYCSGQTKMDRISWSWGWCGRGFVSVWRKLVRCSSNLREAIYNWDRILKGEEIWLEKYIFKPPPEIKVIDVSELHQSGLEQIVFPR